MNKRGAGVIFCLIAAILYAAKYICAATFMTGLSTWNAELFAAGLDYVGPNLSIGSLFFFILGIIYLVYGECEEYLSKKTKRGE